MSQNELQPKKLPTLQELNRSPERAFKNDQFKLLLNKAPKDAWLKVNKFASNAKYLPIDKVEFLMDVIFQDWRVEVLNVMPVFNSVAVTVRLHLLNPVTGEWTYFDGVGAKEMQVDAQQPASNMQAIKGNAVMLGLPIAKSMAIKDAAHHIGKLFGRDVNRKDTQEYTQTYAEPNHEADRMAALIKNAQTVDELELLQDDAATFNQMPLFNQRKAELCK